MTALTVCVAREDPIWGCTAVRHVRGGDWRPDPNWQVVYRQGTVTIYAVPRE